MKKLILAPAVALAFTGLVAAPVAAAETPTTQSASAKAEAEQIKKEKAEKAEKLAEEAEQKKAAEDKGAAEKAAKEKAAKEKAEQDKKDAADKKAADAKDAAKKAADKKKANDKAGKKSGDDAKDSKKPAPKDDDSKESKDSKKDDSDAKDDVEEINASVSVASSIAAEDLADEGLDVTVTNLKKGDRVEVKGSDLSAESTTATGQSATVTLQTEKAAKQIDEGAIALSIKLTRASESGESTTQNLTESLEIQAVEADPKVSLSTNKISVEDFKKDGLKFTGEGFSPNGTVSVTGQAVSTQRAAAQAKKPTADEDGNVSGVVTAPESIEAGKYSLTFIDDKTSEESAPVEVTVTEDDAVDPIDASLKVDPKKITAADLANKDKGVTVTVSGVKKGDKVRDSLTGDTETADSDGDYKLHLWYEGNPKNLEEGKVPFTVTIDREGTESKTLKGNINVVAEDKEDGDDGDKGNNKDTPEAPAEASFTVTPKTLEAADFANDKKGVTLAVEDCEPGADVHFAVKPKGIQVTAYENTVKADDEGKASVSVFGTSDNVSAYVGAYTARATCGDDTMKESFTVTAGANGGGSGGSDDDGNGSDGSQLPRTGADLGGLASGAMLLLIGGAAIAMTGRRKKVGQLPTDF
ncbi:hypothetical protein BSP239C_02889 [Brevibacterium sp. 239c]|uniref:hypothetical protein n=1 Tax=Brevibacterium sp. 239c TaxID=1965356 RepID=UPI000C6BA32F|nr:hypothetical protein [Brevibacterium sp. 239c]SMX98242.1 hypothetical protein BSP239C_02889 [Brevibacterium sp. 239c]